MPGFIVSTYSSSFFVAVTGFASGGIGRSRWKGSNGPDADARVNADVRPRDGVRLSKSNEQTRARPPTP